MRVTKGNLVDTFLESIWFNWYRLDEDVGMYKVKMRSYEEVHYQLIQYQNNWKNYKLTNYR